MRLAVVAALVTGAAARSNATASCGAKGRSMSTQIVNGEDADDCEWKWQVGFQSSTSLRNTPWCGGSLVAEQWVLSAAHCASTPNFYVVAGQYDVRTVSGKEQVKQAVEVIRHPDYNSNTQSHDFVMVKVDSPFTFSDCVGSVCLPSSAVAAGTSCWITGWGTLSSGGSQPKIMQEGQVSIISNSDCVNDYSYTSSDIDSSMLCAQGKSGGKIVDACQGDSGGPLVCASGSTYTLYGATSWGYGCAGAKYPGIWSKISTVTDWVNSVLDGSYVPPPPPPCRRRFCR